EFEIPDDAKGLNPWLIRRWEEYLRARAERKDDVFDAWRSIVASRRSIADAMHELSRTPSINPIIARLVLISPSPGSPGEGRGEGSPTWLAKNPHPGGSK